MTTNHIDTLAEWYESAEQITKTSLPGDGDFIIYPHSGGIGYIIERSEGGWASNLVLPDEPCRILARAPKPKPAWRNAVAVIASTDNLARQVWAREGGGWYGADGYRVDAEALEEVTPLLEAKVTDEMVVTALDYCYQVSPGSNEWPDVTLASMRRALTAALGLETT